MAQRLRIQRGQRTNEVQAPAALTGLGGLTQVLRAAGPAGPAGSAQTATRGRSSPGSHPPGGHRFADISLLPEGEYSVSQPSDASELAADRLAQRALSFTPTGQNLATGAETGADLATAPGADVSRQAASPAAAPAAAKAPAGGAKLPAGGGVPLGDTVRQTFESSFGHDFSQVRVYADSRASAAAEKLNAQAFTVGSGIVFGAGQYAPESAAGQRVLAHELAHVVQSGGEGRTIHRWHDRDHMDTTRDAVNNMGADLFEPIFNPKPKGGVGPYDTGGKIAARLADASVNMDRFVPHPLDSTKESHNAGRVASIGLFGASAVVNSIGRGIGNVTGLRKGRSNSRGVVGEGADHGEAGKYQRYGCEAENEARENHYIDLSVNALRSENIDLALNKLGDAAHVSADRGSHGEGIKGQGHDTPAPGPNEKGTNMPYYMENLNDCDDRAKNPGGYAYGLQKTEAMLVRFYIKAAPLARQPTPETDVALDDDTGI